MVMQENLDCEWEIVRYAWRRLFTLYRSLVATRFATFASRASLSNRGRVAQCVDRCATATQQSDIVKRICRCFLDS